MGLLPSLADAAVEGDVEGVEGGLPLVAPPPAAPAGRVQAHHRQVQALERGLLGREMPAGADRAAEPGVERLGGVGGGDDAADLGSKFRNGTTLRPGALPSLMIAG